MRSALLIAIGVAAFVETRIIVHGAVAARGLHEDLVDDLRMLLGGRRDDGREGIVDVAVGNDVVVQLVEYCRQIARRCFACCGRTKKSRDALRNRVNTRQCSLQLTNQPKRFLFTLRFGLSMDLPVVEVLADFQVARKRAGSVVEVGALL